MTMTVKKNHYSKYSKSAHALAVLGLLSEIDHWTRGAMARDVEGSVVKLDHPDACQFCVIGAIYKTRLQWDRETPGPAHDACNIVELVKESIFDTYPYKPSVFKFNDHIASHLAIVDVLTTAAFIALAKEQPAHP